VSQTSQKTLPFVDWLVWILNFVLFFNSFGLVVAKMSFQAKFVEQDLEFQSTIKD